MVQVHIYNYNSKTDGWKRFPDAELKTIKIDMKMRGIQERDIPFTHYCKNGAALCGAPEPEGSSFYNDPRNTCDGCKEGLRKQTIEARKALDEKDESVNVIDYKAAAAKDKPQSSSVSH